MNNTEYEALLSLYTIPSIGPTKMRKLISSLGSAEDVFNASARQITGIEGFDLKTAEKIKRGPDEKFVKNQMRQIKDFGAQIISFWDERYPPRLKSIFDPPAFIFTKGNLDLTKDHMLAVVGTRVPSYYGKTITERITRELVNHNFTIISGFARGVDSIAHKVALSAGAKTIAVLGNGIDFIYPAENKKLLDKFGNNGLLITEYPFGTKPDGGNFPKRNRIISGMSLGVLITEAGAKSGALLTAMYALDQNREVFAVPGAITSGTSAGTNRLIKQGAKLVECVEDILSEIRSEIGLDIEDSPKPEPDLKGIPAKIYKILDNEPLHIDQVAIRAEISVSEALTNLLTLELLGHVKQMAGKMFIRA